MNQTFDFIFKVGIVGNLLNIRKNKDNGNSYNNIIKLIQYSEQNGNSLEEFYNEKKEVSTEELEVIYNNMKGN